MKKIVNIVEYVLATLFLICSFVAFADLGILGTISFLVLAGIICPNVRMKLDFLFKKKIQARITYVMIALCALGIVGGIINNKHPEYRVAKMPQSSDYYIGKDYRMVSESLKNAGFKNVKFNVVDGDNSSDNGIVENIEIEGIYEFDINDEFEKEAEIIITYQYYEKETFDVNQDKNETDEIAENEILDNEKADQNENADNYIRKEGIMFAADPVICDETTIIINKMKICSDLDYVQSDYNFYYLVIEYEILNNSDYSVEWAFNKESNILGEFKIRNFTRNLGGNTLVEVPEISAIREWRGTLSPDDSFTGSLGLVIDRTLDDPENGLELKKDEPFEVSLFYWENDKKYTLNFSFNQ